MASNICEGAPVRDNETSKALEIIKADYMIVDRNVRAFKLRQSVVEATGTVFGDFCKYEFVETEKDRRQIPQTLQTAKCVKGFDGKCDRRCRPIFYMFMVLRRQRERSGLLKMRTWVAKRVPIIIGYRML